MIGIKTIILREIIVLIICHGFVNKILFLSALNNKYKNRTGIKSKNASLASAAKERKTPDRNNITPDMRCPGIRQKLLPPFIRKLEA